MSQLSWISRCIYFDKKIKKFIKTNPNATIINIGCGLDTTFERVDNGKINWYDLDLPDVIELRKKYLSETQRNKFISESVINTNIWFEKIERRDKVMILLAGVLYYFNENEIKILLGDIGKEFPGTELIFDYCSNKGLEIANKKVIEKGKMEKTAKLKWGIDNIYEIENWNMKMEVIDSIPMFQEFKKNYPIHKRIGMNISDKMKIMSLVHIKITRENSV